MDQFSGRGRRSFDQSSQAGKTGHHALVSDPEVNKTGYLVHSAFAQALRLARALFHRPHKTQRALQIIDDLISYQDFAQKTLQNQSGKHLTFQHKVS